MSAGGGTLELLPQQTAHVERLLRVLDEHPYALDLSMLGAGKTYAASWIAMNRHRNGGGPAFAHVVVVSPVSVQTKWRHMQETYGVPIEHNVSYALLRSVKCRQPKHGLLRRRDYQVKMRTHALLATTIDVDKVEFAPTAKYAAMVEAGTLLILDEIQNLKNVSAQFAAAQALIKPVAEAGRGGRSRVLLLSGSPIDKQEQAATLFRTLNVMTHDCLQAFNPYYGLGEWRGMREIAAFCRGLDARATAAVLGPGEHAADLRQACYDLFQGVVKPALSSAMACPAPGARVVEKNAFYAVRCRRDAALLERGIAALESACAFDRTAGTVNFAHTGGPGAMSAVTRALLQIETAKIGTLARVARARLEGEPNLKVVVCVNYSATLRDLARALSDFRPVVLNGAVNLAGRCDVLRAFQAASGDCRLLIGNLGVCSTGIDLDDKHGGFPRFALVNPNYSSITLYQLSHRFQRMDTRSAAEVHVVYGRDAHELRVLSALSRKGGVMKDTTPEQVEAGVVFPGDYPQFHEGGVPPR